MLDMAGSKLPGIPLTQRAAIEKSLFGTQGSEGFAMLSNPSVLDQVHRLRGMMDDPALKIITILSCLILRRARPSNRPGQR